MTLEEMALEATQYLRDNQDLTEISINVRKTPDHQAPARVDVFQNGQLVDYFQGIYKVLPPPILPPPYAID